MSRVLVIGLDGATFEVMDPLIQQGKLPTIQRLLRRGTRAVLESTPFPHSAPAWTSCLTGVNPGKHSVFGFGVRDDQNSYRFQLPNSTSVKAKTLPRLLTEYGKYSVVMNDPLSYPPYPINGSIISGMLTPHGTCFTFPPELERELLDAVPEYLTEVSPFEFNVNIDTGKATYAEALFNTIRARRRAGKWLMARKSWDFFMVVFTELDRVQHHFWANMDSSHFLHVGRDPSLSTTIQKTYEMLDDSVEMLLDGLPKDTQLFIVSDHGAGPYEKIFYMNQFLQDKGLLKLKEPSKILKALRGVMKRIPGTHAAYNQFRRLRGKKKETNSGGSDPRRYRDKIERWVVEELVEWDHTRVFTDHYGVRVNMRGREPRGIVPSGRETQRVLDELKEELQKLRFPHNGKPVFTHVKESREVYSGPFADRAADLITFMDVGNPHPAYLTGALFRDSLVTTGAHRKNGIFIAWGPGVQQDHSLGRANIVDVAPTVCYAVGIPGTPEMDGTVLNLFEEELNAHKLSDRRGTSMLPQEGQTAYTPEQESEIKNKLKSLGYLD